MLYVPFGPDMKRDGGNRCSNITCCVILRQSGYFFYF